MINASFWKYKKVFITGHTGFKGAWLSILLHELGANVCGYSLNPQTEPSLFKLANLDELMISIFGDVRDLELLKKSMLDFQPDIVIHMAAQPLVRESYVNPVDTYSINVMGTVNVLEAVRKCSSVKAIVNVTTDKVYENKEWHWGYRESDMLGGFDPYSNSKACSEFVTSAYRDSYFHPLKYEQHRVAIATARAGNVIGGGDWANDRIIPDIVKSLENNQKLFIRSPFAIRPWQHVLEPLSGYLLLAEKLFTEGTAWNGAWNFGPPIDSIQNVKTLIETFEKWYESPLAIELDLQNEYHETTTLKLDCSKANNVLHWKSILDFDATVKLTVEWYKRHLNNNVYDLCKNQINEFLKVGDVIE